MIDSWTIYWLTRLDPINDACAGVFFTGCLIFGLGVMVYAISFGDPSDSIEVLRSLARKVAKILAPILLLASIGLVFLPTTKEMCAIIAIPAIANNADVQEIGADVVELCKDWLKDLKDKK